MDDASAPTGTSSWAVRLELDDIEYEVKLVKQIPLGISANWALDLYPVGSTS